MKTLLLILTVLIFASLSGCVQLPVSGTTVPGRPNEPTIETQPAATQPAEGQPSATQPATEQPVVTQPPAATQTAPAPTQASGLSEEELGQQLTEAIEALDFAALRSLMGDQFAIATFNTSLMVYPSDEAMTRLREHFLAQGAQPVVRPGTDVVALLSGKDPLGEWGPVADPVRAVHVMGLGPNAAEEAVLVTGRDANGSFYWHGILVPIGGYFSAATVEPGDAVPTEVKYVMALGDLNLRSGPGMNYAVEGSLFEGQIAQVSGKSADGGWWRVTCEQDASGYCWVSADPALTQPTTAP